MAKLEFLPGFEPKRQTFIAFDLETWTLEEPYGISVAATMEDKLAPRTWYESLSEPAPLSPRQAGFLVDYLKISHDRGYTTLTWNGLAFDYKVLAEVSGQWETCAALALSHVDMMFQFFCAYGFRVGLNTVAHGLGLPGKDGHEDVSGEKAPEVWRGGTKQDRVKVCQYCEDDVRTLLGISKAAADQGHFRWTTKKGRLMTKPFGGKWKTVQECLQIPLPDTSWMDNPPTRESMMDWTFKIREVK